MKLLTACLLVLFQVTLQAQDFRVEPPNWWVGMANDTLELMIEGADAGAMSINSMSKAFEVISVTPGDHPDYLFVTARVTAAARPGTVSLRLDSKKSGPRTINYALKARERAAGSYRGFGASDVICLVTPDRFANGDPSNDKLESMRERETDRTAGFARHGGDLRGLIDHLDYLDDMGFTALWPTPLLENDMPKWSYHGYAITDYYRVDPRFGDLSDYLELAGKLRERGMKLIMDQVVNHCGLGHRWTEKPPFDDWYNFQGNPTMTTHRRTVNQDPYAATIDRELLTRGWFVSTMPDLNQRNPHLATYLVQNSIWWIETLGLGGIRQDTYPYPDKDFLGRWTCAIMAEYPNFNIVGEEWSGNPNTVAYWQRGKETPDDNVSCLPSVMDFPLRQALQEALTEEESWDKGLIKLYEALANDHIYADPQNLLVFLENHDMDRVATQLGGDTSLIKMAHTYLATMRGIPQLYYGSEVLLQNDSLPGDHGAIRADMPGGWAGDPVNAFTGQGLTEQQRAVQNHLRELLNWRKAHPVIATGKTIHFAPQDGIYVFGRYDERERIAVVFNKNREARTLSPERYAELGIATETELPPLSATILELK